MPVLDIGDLRAQHQALADKIEGLTSDEAIAKLETEAAQKEALDKVKLLDAELRQVQQQIEWVDEIQAVKAKNAKPIAAAGAGANLTHMVGGVMPGAGGNAIMVPAGMQIQATKQPWEEPGIAAARFIKCMIAANGNYLMAAELAKQLYPDDGRLNFQAALLAGTGTAGGFLVPEEQSRELIEFLRHLSVVRPNARIVPINGTMLLPTQTAGVAAQYIGESTDDNAQDLTFGQRRLTARKLRALVAVSNDLIRNSAPEADRVVRDDLARGLAEAEDLAFLRGSGASDNPKGMRNWAPAANVINGTGTTAAAIEADLIGQVQRLAAGKKSQLRAPRWFMPTRSFYTLWGLRDGNGNLVFPEIRATPPRLISWPVSTTDQIPITLGGGTETEIYLVDMDDAVIGEEMGIEVAVSSEATYRDGSGNLQSGFSMDQTVMRAIAKHDFLMRRDEAIQLLTGSNVTW